MYFDKLKCFCRSENTVFVDNLYICRTAKSSDVLQQRRNGTEDRIEMNWTPTARTRELYHIYKWIVTNTPILPSTLI